MFLAALFAALLISFKAFANPACAVCTIAVGASLEIARSLGVDDSVVGVWAGAFFILLGFWTIKYFEKKNWNFKWRNQILLAVCFSFIGFMYISKLSYHAEVIGIFYLDPFLFSSIIGAIVLIVSSEFYQWMKQKNGGHAHFPFEKVFVPVFSLFLASLYFYYYPLCQNHLPSLY